jgi:hypothetical protein
MRRHGLTASAAAKMPDVRALMAAALTPHRSVLAPTGRIRLVVRTGRAQHRGRHLQLLKLQAASSSRAAVILMTQPIRADVVRQLVELLSDDTMSIESRIELAKGSDATSQERTAAVLILTKMTMSELVEAGTADVQTPSVYERTMLELRAHALIYSVVGKWDISLRDGVRLGHVMKIIPPDQAKDIEWFIRYGGAR